jgi:hypothetical protein
MRFIAAFTEGYIACAGGVPYDIEASRPAGAEGDRFSYRTDIGPVAPAGNANLIASTMYRFLAANDARACDEMNYTDIMDFPFTTTTETATIDGTDLTLSVGGQAFSCDNVETPGSDGTLSAPLPANKPPVGDAVNALRLGEVVP